MPPAPTRRRFLRSLLGATVGGAALARAEAARGAVTAAAAGTGFRAGDEASVRRLRSAYMLAPEVRYLNHASIGTVPRAVHEAHAAYLALCETRPSLYVWGAPWREATEETRRAAARLLGAEPDDLAVTHNTTEGFNVLAHGLPLEPGDEVLFSSLNHPGASVPWTALAPRRRYTVRRFDVPVERVPEMTEEEVVELHLSALSERTRALVVPHVDNQVGLRHPLRRLADAARARGVRWVLVDGAQSAGMIPVELAEAGVDAYSMSPHKWIQSPKGLGLLWVSPELRPSLPRMWHRREDKGREPSARKYEDYSTRAWPGVVALGDAVDFQLALGEEEKERRRRAVRARIEERVEAEPGLAWASPVSWELGSAIVAIRVRGRSAPEVGRLLLRKHGVDTRAFGPPLNTLRLSPDVSTPVEEIDAALDRMAAAARP